MSALPRNSAYSLVFPENPAFPLLVASPHSGRCYPDDFLAASRQSFRQLQFAEDRFVDLLLQDIPASDTPFLCGEFPRAWCDVNRDPRELDARMFRPALSPSGLLHTAKVKAGFGVLPRCVSQGRAIYSHCLSPCEVTRRLSVCWYPYHEALSATLNTLHDRFGRVVLLDIHSMPPLQQSRHVDIVLGDRHGQSCSTEIVTRVEQVFSRQGYTVQRNVPYAGGFVTQHYGKPAHNVHVLQIEICRSLYLNAATLELSAGFAGLRQDLHAAIMEIATEI